ncbi:rhodanese-like domain-containing protein [Vreelandella alkaliphila]|uniref:rhodanese-like domain-containing protein n=1 Tax=Vreelandella alkaliphila TaxID=272774 RepID=UPI0039F56E95
MSIQYTAHSVRRYLLCLVWGSGVFSGFASADSSPATFNQEGYRLPPFKAPVTAPLPGVTTLDDRAFEALLASPTVILVDVYALSWHNGLFLQDSAHLTIPGSIWLPNVGAPTLEDEWRDYFTQTLDVQRDNSESAPLVFFCRADCWLSWNAARRAEAMGYEELYWYPNGVDGWQASGHSLTAVCPQLPAHAERATCEP